MLIAGEFEYRDSGLFCEEVALVKLAEQHGTPAYVYSRSAIISRFRQYQQALHPVQSRVCYAVKANSNLAILDLLAREGSGFDIVSGGELFRVLSAGAEPESVVFSGVGKTESEIRYGLEVGIHSFNCESERELQKISAIATGLGRSVSIAVRVNPDVDASTHPYISTGLREHKFGVDLAIAEELYGRASTLPGLRLEGVSCHIGSQLLDPGPLLEAADKVIALVNRLRARGLPIRYLDLGGGIGVSYREGDRSPAVPSLIEQLVSKISGLDLTLLLEPGRSIVAEGGILLTRVVLVKRNGSKTFVVVDAGMNDLIRPALYQAHHEILPVRIQGERQTMEVDVVGPVCESGDFFAHGRRIPELHEGDLVAIQTAGAYGFVLSSNYNSRPRCPELLIDGPKVLVARQRESYNDLIRGEQRLTS